MSILDLHQPGVENLDSVGRVVSIFLCRILVLHKIVSYFGSVPLAGRFDEWATSKQATSGILFLTSQNQHRITVAVKPILFSNRFFICMPQQICSTQGLHE